MVIGVYFLIILFISWTFFPLYNQKGVIVVIPPGSDSFKIAQILSEQKVIKSKVLFILLSKILGWEKDLRAGKYEFISPHMIKVLRKLRKGQVKTYRVTIPEGLPKWEVAHILDQEGIVKREDFLAIVDNPQIFKECFPFPLPEHSLEGYLYPDTYYFTKEESPQEVVKKFLSRFEEVIFSLYQEKKNNFSLKQIVILASIVEKEARISSEKPLIAAVFYNRLQKGIRLRADPTIKYALGNFQKRLTRYQLRVPSSYNTYLYYGLPAGSICNPGKDSIYAVLQPAKVNYLYFVAKGDGSHKFSNTYKQHLKAVYQYQQKG